MTKISFYQVKTITLEKALIQILNKAYLAKINTLVVTGSSDRTEMLDDLLWTFDKESFLPHGTLRDPEPQKQAILICDNIDNQNSATLLVLVDGTYIELVNDFDRCIDIFDGRIAEQIDEAENRILKRSNQGHEINKFEQDNNGKWVSNNHGQ